MMDIDLGKQRLQMDLHLTDLKIQAERVKTKDIEPLTVTEDGIYEAVGKDGFSPVTVKIAEPLEQVIAEKDKVISEKDEALTEALAEVERLKYIFAGMVAFNASSYLFDNGFEITAADFEKNEYKGLRHSAFQYCYNLRKVTTPPLDTLGNNVFSSCINLVELELNINAVYAAKIKFSGTVINCTSLKKIKISHIANSVQVGSGTSWGHLLTLDSLIGLCRECIDTGKLLTLTVGSANLEKLENVYVRLIEDDGSGKLPFEVCESTDEGALTIEQYLFEKNWEIK